MILKYRAGIQSIHTLLPGAQYLEDNSMQEKTVQINYQENTHNLVIRTEYVGVDSHITAQLGDTHLLFETNSAGGIDLISQGPTLEEGLTNEIIRAIIIELDNWIIEDKDK